MEDLKLQIANAMGKIAEDDLKKSPLKNSPLASMAILESLNYSSNRYKEYLLENKSEFKITDTEIDIIIDKCYQIVYNHFLD